MNEQSQLRLRHHWLGWIALLAFASVLSPIHIHIVIAQDLPEIVIAPAEPGEPPAPPETQKSPAVATEAPAGLMVEELSIDDPTPTESAVQTPDVPATPSEVTSDTEIGRLIPTDEPQAESISNEQTKTDPDSIRTLSVEPGLKPILPANRPGWVGAVPDYTSSKHHLYVGSLPTTDESEADKALDEPLLAAVRDYIDQKVVNDHGASAQMPIDAEFIRRNLIDDHAGYLCELSTSQGEMYQKWVTVNVTPEQRRQFAQWHTEASQRSRLAPLGLGLVSVLALVSLSHLVLRRQHTAISPPIVNLQVPELAAKRPVRSSAAKLMFFALLISAVAFAFLLPLFALTFVRVQTTQTDGPVSGPLEQVSKSHSIETHDLHKEVRIETLNGNQRTIILESKSRR